MTRKQAEEELKEWGYLIEKVYNQEGYIGIRKQNFNGRLMSIRQRSINRFEKEDMLEQIIHQEKDYMIETAKQKIMELIGYES
jgi:hypothetical protein